MSGSDPKKLVLGLVSNMTLEKAQPFFLSLEKSGYRGEICMAVSGLDAATQAFLRARRVQLIPYERERLKPRWTRALRWLAAIMPPGQRRIMESRLAPAYIHPHCSRYFFYQSYIESCSAAYSHVFLTDVRDMIFQADPFAFEVPDGLSVFLADRSKTIGTCDFNTSSMRRGFGERALQAWRDKPIACAGTTLGTTEAIRDYLEKVTRLLCGTKQRESIDQGVHNYSIHQYPPAKLNVFENFSGPVLTMAHIPPARIQLDGQNRLLNTDGSVINTLHQYDRHTHVMDKLLKAVT
ncbi:MAG TPA: hypothetical protein VG347_15980 [Verrucomicrobiae bacterium]|nr:hypothetical protein [Verrucomicrobiae bacterium]